MATGAYPATANPFGEDACPIERRVGFDGFEDEIQPRRSFGGVYRARIGHPLR